MSPSETPSVLDSYMEKGAANMSSESEIIFTTPILTPITGEPNLASLRLLQGELNANAL